MDEEEKAQMERMKEKAAAANKKVKHIVAKSLIIWEVKPWDEETNLDELAQMILGIQQEGLEWKTEYKKEPVAYGVFKLVIGAVVEDEKVSTDDIEEKILAFEDYCQSVDIAAFNKL
jgi:translation elongation factor EF-1beta